MRLLTDIGDSIADSAHLVLLVAFVLLGASMRFSAEGWRLYATARVAGERKARAREGGPGPKHPIEEIQTGTNYNCLLTLSQKPSRVKSSCVLERFDGLRTRQAAFEPGDLYCDELEGVL
jgi:hypothetical protein